MEGLQKKISLSWFILFLTGIGILITVFVLQTHQELRSLSQSKKVSYSLSITPTPSLSPTPPISQSLSEIIEQEYRKLEEGIRAYNPPQEMTLGKEEIIQLRIAKNGSSSSISMRGMEKNRLNQYDSIKVSALMSASLIGDKFKITPLSTEEQFIADAHTEWCWSVEPTEACIHDIALRVSIKMELENSHITSDFPVKLTSITVKDSWHEHISRFLHQNKNIFDEAMGNILAATVIGIGGVIVARILYLYRNFFKSVFRKIMKKFKPVKRRNNKTPA